MYKLASVHIKYVIILVVLISASYTGYKHWQKVSAPSSEDKLVEVETINRADFSRHIKLVGHVRAAKQTTFQASDAGVVGDPLVSEGQAVKAGTPLIEIQAEPHKDKFEAAQKAVELATVNFQRQQKLATSKSTSQHNLEVAEGDLARAKANLAEALDKLNKHRFVAPYDGVCGVFMATPGQYVSSGDVIVTFYDPSNLVLLIDLPGSIMPYVKIGTTFTIGKVQGKVDSVQQALDPTNKMGVAKATLPNNAKLLLGSVVSVNMEVSLRANTISLPKTAISVKDEKPYVFKVVDGKATLEFVELGIEGEDRVEITKGLKPGDKVVLRGQENLWPTQPVKIQEVKR